MNPDQYKQALDGFRENPPAESSLIRQSESGLPFELPASYTQFLQYANGGQGFIGEQYVILWRIEELVDLNMAYEVRDNAPGLFLFGSDGGGEAFAFDLRSESLPIVSVPFVGMDLSLALAIAPSLGSFLEQLCESIAAMEEPTYRPEDSDGKEVFEIQPVILGGSPTSPGNKAMLNRQQHIEAVKYWNGIVRTMRSNS